MGADSTPAALPRRPEARAFSVEDLVLAVLSGQIRVPIFQRSFRWEIGDVLALLDSIDRGYPIGSVLLWKRPARSEHLVHGSVVVDAPERHDALWVIDGQQRILSLTRVLAGKGHPDEPLAVFYDLETRSFKHLAPGESPAPHDLPLTELLDSSKLIDWLVAHHEAGVARQAATSLGKRLREFQLPAYVVDTDDEDTAHAIFLRTNTTGKPLLATDVFHAIHHHRSDSPTSLQDVARSLDDLAFGPLEDDLVLNMLLATRGTMLGKTGAIQLAPSEVHRATADFVRSARSTITFLRHDAEIPHVSLFPVHGLLAVFSRFFHHHPEPHPRTRELLTRYLWRHMVRGPLWRWSSVPGVLALIDDDEDGTIQRLIKSSPPKPGSTDPTLEVHARGDTAVARLALLALQPRSLLTGERVAPPPAALRMPDAYLRVFRPLFLREHEHALAELIVHPDTPTDLAAAITACEAPDILRSHGISREAQRVLRLGRIDHFISLRSHDLARHIEDFIARRAEWDEPDTPPVEALHLRADD